MSETWTLPDTSLEALWFVDMSKVRLDDLINAQPGSIVRCSGLPAVQYVPASVEAYDRIAGMISDCA